MKTKTQNEAMARALGRIFAYLYEVEEKVPRTYDGLIEKMQEILKEEVKKEEAAEQAEPQIEEKYKACNGDSCKDCDSRQKEKNCPACVRVDCLMRRECKKYKDTVGSWEFPGFMRTKDTDSVKEIKINDTMTMVVEDQAGEVEKKSKTLTDKEKEEIKGMNLVDLYRFCKSKGITGIRTRQNRGYYLLQLYGSGLIDYEDLHNFTGKYLKDERKTEEADETWKIKVTDIYVVVSGSEDRPYYEIMYKEVGKDGYTKGYGSCNLGLVYGRQRDNFVVVVEEEKSGDCE